MIDELVSYNREFVKNKGYEKYITCLLYTSDAADE